MQTKRRWMTTAITSAGKPQAALPWTRQARKAAKSDRAGATARVVAR